MSVYFIQVGDTGAIKIGYASDPMRRLRELQVAHPEPLRLIAVAPGDLAREGELHRQFVDSRIGREWYRASPELLAFCVANECQPVSSGRPGRKRNAAANIALDGFLAESGMSLADFGGMVGCTHTQISRIAAGKRKPSLALACRIVAATKGAVPFASFGAA